MSNGGRIRAFTMAELLALLCCGTVAIALIIPLIGSAKANDHVAITLNNLKNMNAALASYASDFNGRQPTPVADDISSYIGVSMQQVLAAYQSVNGTPHPPLQLGTCNSVNWAYTFQNGSNNGVVLHPIQFGPGTGQRFGSFRLTNSKMLHDYVNGKWYDPTFYAPGDRAIYGLVESLFDHSCEYIDPATLGGNRWSSYSMSPAAMYDPMVLRAELDGGYVDPFSFNEGFKSPGVAQAKYPNLKTRLCEHYWNQNTPANVCNPNFVNGTAAGCEPYFFNHGFQSAPAALFFDGSTRLLPNVEVSTADLQILEQTKEEDGLWHRGTPLSWNGYYNQFSIDDVDLAHHILTTDGILGRDTIDAGK